MASSELLRNLNIAAWVLHGFLLLALLGWRLTREDANTRAPLFAQSFEMGADDERWYSVGLRKTEASVDLWGLTAFFTAVTSVAHLLYATYLREAYDANVAAGVQAFRWVEYGLSATPMYVIVSLLAGVRTATGLVIVAAAALGTMLQGYLVEESLRSKSLRAAVAALLAGWILFLGNWIVIISEWYLGLQDSRDTIRAIVRDDGDRPGGPPDNLEALIFVMFALFASFGGVACYRLLSCAGYLGGAPCDYVTIELAYVSLSFASKFILGIWLLSSVFTETPWLNQICGCVGDECVPGRLPG